MRGKTLLIGVVGVVIGVLLSAAVVFAGSLNPGSGPGDAGSQMYTLQQIYDRLTTGAAGTKMTTFTEPAVGPAPTMRTLDEIMAVAPVSRADRATQAEVIGGKTYWGLGVVGEWGLLTGTGNFGNTYGAAVPKTGQTTCYNAAGAVISCTNTRQDGDLRRGVAWPTPRFTDHGNGTVTDNLTGLMWLKNANCANAARGWSTTLTDVASLNSTGTMNGNNCGDTSNGGSHRTDWRLPNAREMGSLVDYGRSGPALPSGHPFTGVSSVYYWASTSAASLSGSRAWRVDLGTGDVNITGKSFNFNVWPVRGGS